MVTRIEGKYCLTGIICLTVTLLFADQNLLAPNLSQIAEEFHFSEHEKNTKLGSNIALGFFVIGAPAAILLGYLADIFPRIMTGISIGGSIPVIFSILGDLYSSKHRVYVSTLVGVSMSAGISGGQLIAGILGPLCGWRSPFLVISLPSLIIGIVLGLICVEPRRGLAESSSQCVIIQENSRVSREGSWSEHSFVVETQEETHAHYDEKINVSKIKDLFCTPSVMLILLQGIPGCLPWGMIYVFLNDYLSQNRSFSVQSATIVLFSFGIGSVVGQIFGGIVGQNLYSVSRFSQCLLMSISTLLSIPSMIFILISDSRWFYWVIFVAFLSGTTVSINGPNIRSILQVRGTAFAFFTLTDDLGKGAGPVLVVQAIEMYNGDKMKAFVFVTFFWFLCAVIILALGFVYKSDETKALDSIKNSLKISISTPVAPSSTSVKDVDRMLSDDEVFSVLIQ